MRLWLHLDLRRPQPFSLLRSGIPVLQGSRTRKFPREPVNFLRKQVLKLGFTYYAIFSGILFTIMHCFSLNQGLLPIRESLGFPKTAKSFLFENFPGNLENSWSRFAYLTVIVSRQYLHFTPITIFF